ncbi:Protein of unknown function [Bryocella elongata]|uniref:Uncharacterized protein n=1 Tax=Bryocella elongata TaxID=863522 RepID=A0A1H6BJI4_9BACT|nr:DUF1778 domain-containing protein [Bryocella elongata]SEG60843.1 Protein of unknown function [Bryocella elongata]
MAGTSGVVNPIDLHVTMEQLMLLREAAERERSSLEGFVLDAALDAARAHSSSKRRVTRDEALALLREARAAVRHANPLNRDLAAELLDERRAEADRE